MYIHYYILFDYVCVLCVHCIEEVGSHCFMQVYVQKHQVGNKLGCFFNTVTHGYIATMGISEKALLRQG